MTALLEIKDLHVAYGKVEAVRGVALTMEPGQIVTVNGDESLRFVDEADWRTAEATQALLAPHLVRTPTVRWQSATLARNRGALVRRISHPVTMD